MPVSFSLSLLGVPCIAGGDGGGGYGAGPLRRVRRRFGASPRPEGNTYVCDLHFICTYVILLTTSYCFSLLLCMY